MGAAAVMANTAIATAGDVRVMAEAFKKYKNRGNEDTIEGFMHLRKAHYMCGWDWGACLPDGGIFRPVTLFFSGN